MDVNIGRFVWHLLVSDFCKMEEGVPCKNISPPVAVFFKQRGGWGGVGWSRLEPYPFREFERVRRLLRRRGISGSQFHWRNARPGAGIPYRPSAEWYTDGKTIVNAGKHRGTDQRRHNARSNFSLYTHAQVFN